MTDYVAQIFPRAGTAAAWADLNPTDHRAGEVLWETDTGRMKYGTGNGEPYLDLPYEPFRGQLPAATDVTYAGSADGGPPAGTVESAIDAIDAALGTHAATYGPGAHLADAPDGTPDDYVFRADGTWGAQTGSGGGGATTAAELAFAPVPGQIDATDTQAAVVEVAGDAAAAASTATAAQTAATNAATAATAAGDAAADVAGDLTTAVATSRVLAPLMMVWNTATSRYETVDGSIPPDNYPGVVMFVGPADPGTAASTFPTPRGYVDRDIQFVTAAS